MQISTVSIGRFGTSWTIAVVVLSAILSSHGKGVAGAFLGTGAGGIIAISALTGLHRNGVAAQSQTTFHESEIVVLMILKSPHTVASFHSPLLQINENKNVVHATLCNKASTPVLQL